LLVFLRTHRHNQVTHPENLDRTACLGTEAVESLRAQQIM
jgi:hypothetical protein